jgi:hypothetical protein
MPHRIQSAALEQVTKRQQSPNALLGLYSTHEAAASRRHSHRDAKAKVR